MEQNVYSTNRRNVFFFSSLFYRNLDGAGRQYRQISPVLHQPYDKMTACNLIFNMIHDSDANSAMKMLQTKLESLTLVIGNKPSSPLSRVRNLRYTSAWVCVYVQSFLDLTLFEKNQSLIFLSAVPASSCKQQKKNISKLAVHSLLCIRLKSANRFSYFLCGDCDHEVNWLFATPFCDEILG